LNKLKSQVNKSGGVFSPKNDSVNKRSPRTDDNSGHQHAQSSSRQLSKDEISGERFDTDSLKT